MQLGQQRNFWKTKEQQIDGLCEVTYQVNELPKYMIRDRPELVPQRQQCQEDKYYEIVKTKNVDNCERRSAFSFVNPGHYMCKGPNCKDMWARTSETRYIACGSRGNLMVQTIINQGELNQDLSGINTERIVTGTLQVLRLREVRSQSPKPQPSNMTPLKNMMYEYSFKAYESVQRQEEQMQQMNRIPRDVAKDPEQLAKAIPAVSMMAHKRIPKSKIMQEVKSLVQTLIEELQRPIETNAVEKQVPMKVLAVARALAMLSKTEIQQIYQQVKPQLGQQHKNLFFDAVVMAGTPESVYFLKEQIESGELSKINIISLFYMLPNTLMFPTQEVLEQLIELSKSQRIQDCRFTRNVVMMSITTLLEKACLSKNREIKYPVWVMGEMCHPNSRVLQEKWIPHLLKELETSQHMYRKNEIIVALGMLPHEQIIGKLIPIVEGRVQHMTQVPRMTRLLALWSLATSGMIKPQTVEPIFYSIFANPAEATEMRIAAFNVLLKLNPAMDVFQKIAARTWYEQDKEVLKVVNTALWTLSQENWTAQQGVSQVMTLGKKARLTYPLIKKTREILPTSFSFYTSQKFERLGTGLEGMTNWIASETSFIPLEFYTELRYFLSQYNFKPFALGLRMQGAENLYNKLHELIEPLQSGQSVEEQIEGMKRQIESSLNSEWRKVIEKLNIKTRDSSKMSGAVFVNLMETTPFFANFAEMTTKQMKEEVIRIFKDRQSVKEMIEQERKISLRTAGEQFKAQNLIPSDMGIPIIINNRMPVVSSVEGMTKVHLSFRQPSAMLKAKVFHTMQFIAEVAMVNPFNKEYLTTTFDQSLVIQLPLEVKVELDMPAQLAVFKIKMLEQFSKVFDMVHYHVHPFTAKQSVESLTPASLSPEKRMIESRDQLKQVSKTFGEYLGLHMTTQVRTESRFYDFKTLFDKLSLYHYNPLNMFRFVFSNLALDDQSRPSIRRHEYTLKFDPTQSSTKEIKFQLKVGYAAKTEQSEPVKYMKVKMISEQEAVEESKKVPATSPVFKALRKLMPFTIESEPVQEKRSHPERQEKIVKAVESLDKSLESISALTFKLSTTLEGSSRPRTWKYFMTLVGGQKQESSERRIKSQWNINLQSEQSQKSIVLRGKLESPTLPVWEESEIRNSLIDFRFHNTLEVLESGSRQWNIDVTGNSKVSHEQKEFSKVSQEAKRCQLLKERKQSEKAVLAKLSPACEKVREQSATLDEVEFTIRYNNVPRSVEYVETMAVDSMKALLWPFRRINEERSRVNMENSIRSAPVMVRLVFNKRSPSFDMTVQRPQEELKFRQIRLPSVVRKVLPLKAGVNNVKLIAQKLTGHSLFPVCKLESQTLKTFDNKTFPAHLDYCYHLLAADCSQSKSFSVMARNMKPGDRKELKVVLGQTIIKIVPQSSSLQSQKRIIVDEQELTIQPNQWLQVRSKLNRNSVVAHVFRSQNNVIQIKGEWQKIQLTFDGQNVAVEVAPVYKSLMCGMCGNFNQQVKDELEGPSKCMYSKPEIKIASYRINNLPQSCEQEKPLSQMIKQKLEKETSECIKRKQIPTKVNLQKI